LQKLWIKICGITRQQDALSAAEMGADAIGLVFYAASPRAVELQDIASIVQGLPGETTVVALFVDADEAAVQAIVQTGLVNCLQFHGNETASYCQSFALPYMKAIRVGERQDLGAQIRQFASADYILLDSFDPTTAGGSGKVFDWAEAASLANRGDVKLVLAGGLNPENIQTAIATVQPFGVDVSSGVEASKGIKDLAKMKAFIEGARASV